MVSVWDGDMKLDIDIEGLKIENVESIVFPTEEKSQWVTTYNKAKMVCASKGAPVSLGVTEP